MFWLTENVILPQALIFTIWVKDKFPIVIVNVIKSVGWKGQWYCLARTIAPLSQSIVIKNHLSRYDQKQNTLEHMNNSHIR